MTKGLTKNNISHFEKQEAKVNKQLGLASIQNVISHFEKQEAKANKQLGLTDAQCAMLIECSLSSWCDHKDLGETHKLSMLPICVNRPPCKPGEEEVVYRGNKGARKWCKKRSKYGTPEFIEESKKTLKIISEQINKDRQKRLKKLSNEDKIESKTLLKDYNQLKLRLQKLNKINIQDDKNGDEEFIKLQMSRLQKLNGKKNKKQQLKELKNTTLVLKKLTDNKNKLELEKEVLKIIKNSNKKIFETIKNGFNEQKQNENISKFQEESTNDLLKQLLKNMSATQQRLDTIEEKINYTVRSARHTLGEQYWNEELKHFLKGGIKNIIYKTALAPFKAFNIIILKPAFYAFWTFFGRWAYLIWGMISLLILVLLTISFYSKMSSKYPEFIESLMQSLNYIVQLARGTGSILANWIGQETSNGWNELYKSMVDKGTAAKNELMEWINTFFGMIFEYIQNILISNIMSVLRQTPFGYWMREQQ